MSIKNKKGFTLIELVAVLVIMAIIALIVTPLVMSIIRKAKIAADKRSVDAYGRSIELAIAGYLMDTGTFPTSISQLTIEYSGDEVVCSTTQLKSDSSIYLAGCTVGGRSVDGYTYGKEETVTYDAYTAGQSVTYNGKSYYVLNDSGASKANVTLIKAEPITSAEISSYLPSTEIASKVDTNGTYATMAYYAAADCVSAGDVSGCTTDYSVSNVKQLVDIWATNYTNSSDLVADSTGYKARLMTYDELSEAVELEMVQTPSEPYYQIPSSATWLYNNSYWYWTMSQGSDSAAVWRVNSGGNLDSYSVLGTGYAVRPVITLSKTSISS